MKDLIVKNVNVFGDQIVAVQNNTGNIYAGINYFCAALGMTKGQIDRQVRNIQQDAVLSKACAKFGAGVFSKFNATLALQIDYIPLWLAKINITDAILRDNPDLAEKLLNYQLKAKDILAEAFMPQLPTTNEGKIQLLAQHKLEIAENIRKIDAKADDIKTELEEFKETMPLLPIEADEIVKAIKKKGVEVMGGIDTLAYKDRCTRSAVYRDIHAQLWREFGVTSYKAIAHKYLQKAFEVIEAYKLPTTLIDRINEANLKATA